MDYTKRAVIKYSYLQIFNTRMLCAELVTSKLEFIQHGSNHLATSVLYSR
jgi:hypothetical protein